MELQASRHVWSHLPPSEQGEVAEEIARILTEETEHERIDQSLAGTLETSCGRLSEAIGSEAGALES